MPSSKYQLENSTYKLIANGNPKDRIEVCIGDEKEPDFKPRLKIKRWDNEVNFSVGLIDEGGTYEKKDEKIEYKGNRQAIFYELEDGYEFEEILDKKPESNVLEYSIETKNLVFYYQPELTEKEKKDGMIRPENVVGSYAVYHSEKPINYKGGKEYKTGKVGHIYRPKIIDADGKEIWGVLNIDTEKNLLTITIDENWLKEAKYPVVVDPTFGYTSKGASSGQNGVPVGVYGTPTENGTIRSITAYIKGDISSSYSFECALYKNNGTTKDFIEETEQINFNNQNFDKWQEFRLSQNPEIFTTETYPIVIWCGGDIGEVYYDVASSGVFMQMLTYPEWANSVTSGYWFEDNYKFSIYATYALNTQGPVTVIQADSMLPNALGVYEYEGVRYDYDNYFKNANNWYCWHDTPDYWMLGTDPSGSYSTYISAGTGILPDNDWSDWSGWGYDPPIVVWGREFDANAGQSADFALYAAYPKVGQSITADATEKLTSAVFYLKDIGGPTGNIVAKLYAHSGTFGTSSVGTGAALATSDTKDVAEFDGVSSPKVFTFDGTFELQEGTNYVIVLEYSGGDNQNYVAVRYDGTSPTHAGNMFYWYQIGGYYYAESGKDLQFSIYRLGDASVESTPVTVEPATVTATSTLPAPTITAQKAATISPAQQVSTAVLPAPTITAQRAATIEPTFLQSDGVLPDPTITAGISITVDADILTASTALLGSSIEADQSMTINVEVLTAQASIQEPTEQYGHVVSVDELSATGAILEPEITAGQSVTISPDVLGASSAVNESTENYGYVIDVASLEIIATLLDPDLELGGGLTLSMQTLVAQAVILQPDLIYGHTISPATLTALSGLFDTTITLGSGANVDADTLSAQSTLVEPDLSTGSGTTINPQVLIATSVVNDPTITEAKSAIVPVDTLIAISGIIQPVAGAAQSVIIEPETLRAFSHLYLEVVSVFTKPYKKMGNYAQGEAYEKNSNVYIRQNPYSQVSVYKKRDYDN